MIALLIRRCIILAVHYSFADSLILSYGCRYTNIYTVLSSNYIIYYIHLRAET